MASVKIKFRPSSIYGREGSIYYQIIFNRVTRQIHSDYKILPAEWNEKHGCILMAQNRERTDYISSIIESVRWELDLLRQIIQRNRYSSADEIVEAFSCQKLSQSFYNFMKATIARLKLLGKNRTSENYITTFNSFRSFRGEQDVMLSAIDADLMEQYEAYLSDRGVTANTISFYMRILRAVYNRAVDKGIIEQRFPFRRVYTGIAKTVKRALPMNALKLIKSLDLSLHSHLEFARDVFMFSFYTRGMSFVDIAFLRKSDLRNGILTYCRRKTGQRLSIRWEECMQEIVKKYPSNPMSPYLLPIIHSKGDEGKHYRYQLSKINKGLKEIARLVGLSTNLTMYVARHSWASIAHSKNIPISVISEGMGHDSEVTTQIYLTSLDNAIVDKANALILKGL